MSEIETELLEANFLEDKFNFLVELSEYQIKSLAYVTELVDSLAKYYRTVFSQFAYLIYLSRNSEVNFNSDVIDKYVWTITAIEDGSYITLKATRKGIPQGEDESNNSSSGIE